MGRAGGLAGGAGVGSLAEGLGPGVVGCPGRREGWICPHPPGDLRTALELLPAPWIHPSPSGSLPGPTSALPHPSLAPLESAPILSLHPPHPLGSAPAPPESAPTPWICPHSSSEPTPAPCSLCSPPQTVPAGAEPGSAEQQLGPVQQPGRAVPSCPAPGLRSRARHHPQPAGQRGAPPAAAGSGRGLGPQHPPAHTGEGQGAQGKPRPGVPGTGHGVGHGPGTEMGQGDPRILQGQIVGRRKEPLEGCVGLWGSPQGQQGPTFGNIKQTCGGGTVPQERDQGVLPQEEGSGGLQEEIWGLLFQG